MDTGGDRFLEHALIYALIRIREPAAVRPGLHAPSPAVRRGALIALDQMANGGLTPQDVLPMLDPGYPDLRRAALNVVTAHPEFDYADLASRSALFVDLRGVTRGQRVDNVVRL